MRAPGLSIVHDTVSMCFDEAVRILGPGVRETVYFHLARRGIQKHEISSRFKDVENALAYLFGKGAKSILVLTLSKLCEEYSLRLQIEYAESAVERLRQLIDTIMIDKLLPKHHRKRLEDGTYEDKLGVYAPWTD